MALVLMTAFLMLVPLLDISLALHSWQGIIPTFTDENFYYARMHALLTGHVTTGNPYYLEHTDGPPLVIFAGVWLSAVPFFLGLPPLAALYVNFIVWSLAFIAAAYALLRALRVSAWWSVFGVLAMYAESFAHVWRPVNLQTVFPVYFLFYLALLRSIEKPNRRHVWLLGATTGVNCYLFSYLWQAAVITLVPLFLFALVRKEWLLARAIFFTGLIGGGIGLPIPLYALWLSHTSPYFWESVYRLGLVNTHIPTSEIFYSGGWVWALCALAVFVLWCQPLLRRDTVFTKLILFICISGLGLWCMQASNAITGKWLETGEHVRLLILPWLMFATLALALALWQRRAALSRPLFFAAVGWVCVLIGANMYFGSLYIAPFLPHRATALRWQDEQAFAKPFAWLNTQAPGAVVWSNPNDDITEFIPLYTRDFVLSTYFGMLELVPEQEIRERYLVSQYFDKPTAADLATDADMSQYLGRRDYPHEAKTIEREVKLCRMFFFFNKQHDCGAIPTPQSLLGPQFFAELAAKFTDDIHPHIVSYLKKYHVTYILKDKLYDTQYHPEILGAKKVYADERFEIYKL